MARIYWTNNALSDIERIGDYVAESSPANAVKLTETLFKSVARLRIFPQSGHFVFDVPETPLREILSGGYRVLYSYSIEEDACKIVAVVHGSRSLLRLLEDRDFEFSD